MRLHSLLLYLYPSSFRHEYGEELSHIFSERRQQSGNGFSVIWLWISEIIDVIKNASPAHWDILRQDLRYGLRTLARARGFTITAIVITGLGIGANTAAFSVIDHVLLRPFPFPDADRMVQLWQGSPGYPQVELSPPNFYDWQRLSTSFEAMAAYTGAAANFLGESEPQRLDGTAVTPEFFNILGVQPFLGRVFNADDVREKAAKAVIVSYAFWQSTLGGIPDVLTKGIRLDSDSYTVIGVMPPDFSFPSRGKQIWIPLVLGDPPKDSRDNLYLQAMAKLKPGVSLEQARAELAVIAGRLAQQYPKENEKVRAVVEPLRDQVPNQTRLLLWALFGASFCVLLIACTNLAGLLLAKAISRRKELTVRAAVGAGRERLVRQLLTESLVLALLGGALGVLFAVIGLPLLLGLVPARLPISDVTVLDRRVFVFAALVTAITALAFGVAPALRMCKGVTYEGLQEGSRSGIGGRREWFRSMLVVTEIAASIVLLVSAGLLIRALWRVQSIDPGFRTDSVLSLQTYLPMPRYASNATRAGFYNDVLTNVRALPGIMNAGYISSLPMLPGGGIWPVTVPGMQGGGTSDAALTVAIRVVSPGYLDTLGIALRSGRDIRESDTLSSPYVAIVSESFVRRYWPNQDPIGRTFHFAFENFPFAEQDRTVVGVVNDVRFRGLERPSEPQVYLAYNQLPDRTATFYAPRELVIRSSTDPASIIPVIRRIIQKADAEMPITAVRPLREVVDLQTAPRSTQIRLVACFALLSLLLAGIGIHGLLSFAVGQRSQEFGLRIALGAKSRDVLGMVFRDGIFLSGIGVTLGLFLSFYSGRSIQALLAGVGPFDPGTVAVVCLVALAMTLSGSLLPGIRAMRTNPVTVIRGE